LDTASAQIGTKGHIVLLGSFFIFSK